MSKHKKTAPTTTLVGVMIFPREKINLSNLWLQFRFTLVRIRCLLGPAHTELAALLRALRCWDEEMLDDAGKMICEEVSLLTTAPGGMVEYRKTLAISFLFKFYLDVLKQLKMRVNLCLPVGCPGEGSLS